MTILSPSLSVIILNVKELNLPIKRHSAATWVQKKNLSTYYPEGTQL